jgi:hypothetical protein
MTEDQWLAATDPTPMLTFLRGRSSERKLRLFTTACARLLWDRVPHGIMRDAVEAADRCADGTPWEDELSGYCHRLYAVIDDYGRDTGRNWFTDHTREEVGFRFTVLQATAAGCGLLTVVTSPSSMKAAFTLPLTGPRQPSLIRDIFGNPLRPVTIHPDWLTPTVRSLADGIYAERAFDRLPILAQALRDAGCGSADVLDHCRSAGPHVRGCWMVDLVLGKP